MGLVTIAIAAPAFVGAFRYSNNTEKLVPFMRLNVIVNLMTPILVAIGLFIG